MNIQTVRRRIMAALFFAQGIFTAALIISFTLSPIIAADLGGSDGAAGLPSTINLIGRGLFAFPAGWLMDRLGRRLGLSLGFLLGIVGALISVVAILQSSLLAFLLGALLLGALRGVAEQGRYVAAEVHGVAHRARAIGIIVTAGTVGAVGGPLLVSPSEQWMLGQRLPGTVGPFIVSGILLAVGLAAIFVFLRPDPLQVSRELELASPLSAEPQGPSLSLAVIFRRPGLRFAVVTMAIAQLVMTLLMVVTPLYMDHLDQNTRMISWVIMAHTVGMFGLSSVNGWAASRFGRVNMILLGSLLLIVSAIMAPLVVGVPLLALSLFLLGLGWNVCFVSGSALLADAVSAAERGRVQGASETMVAIASGLGSVGAGLLFQLSGMTFPGVAGLALSLSLLAYAAYVAWPGRALVATRETQ